MRRLLRDIAAGKETVGDTTTLEDYSVLALHAARNGLLARSGACRSLAR